MLRHVQDHARRLLMLSALMLVLVGVQACAPTPEPDCGPSPTGEPDTLQEGETGEPDTLQEGETGEPDSSGPSPTGEPDSSGPSPTGEPDSMIYGYAASGLDAGAGCGWVAGASGGLDGVMVELRNIGGVVQTATTDSRGCYQFANVAYPGEYTVIAPTAHVTATLTCETDGTADGSSNASLTSTSKLVEGGNFGYGP